MGFGKKIKKAAKRVTHSVTKAYSDTVGKAADVVWNEPTKGIRDEIKDVVGEHAYNLGSAVGSAILSGGTSLAMDATGGIGELASELHQAKKIQEDDVVKAAYIAAGTIGAIGALGAEGGITFGADTAATAGGTAAAATAAETAAGSGGLSLGTALGLGAVGLSAYSGIMQSKAMKEMYSEQSNAEARARADAEAAARESEILRKQALLASQKSMSARRAAAGAIANKLKNTQTFLGSEEEKLGD